MKNKLGECGSSLADHRALYVKWRCQRRCQDNVRFLTKECPSAASHEASVRPSSRLERKLSGEEGREIGKAWCGLLRVFFRKERLLSACWEWKGQCKCRVRREYWPQCQPNLFLIISELFRRNSTKLPNSQSTLSVQITWIVQNTRSKLSVQIFHLLPNNVCNVLHSW